MIITPNCPKLKLELLTNGIDLLCVKYQPIKMFDSLIRSGIFFDKKNAWDTRIEEFFLSLNNQGIINQLEKEANEGRRNRRGVERSRNMKNVVRDGGKGR